MSESIETQVEAMAERCQRSRVRFGELRDCLRSMDRLAEHITPYLLRSSGENRGVDRRNR